MKHKHPHSDAVIEGRRLDFNETIQKDDRYDSTDGTWQKCPPGLDGMPVPNNPNVVWVRPK